MSRREVDGKCHICGRYTKLTFEHVPPRSAFNNRPVVNTPFENLVNAPDLDHLKGPITQKGSGGYTLCAQCNNDTGRWYGKSFVDWTYQGLSYSEIAKHNPHASFLFRIHPLRVIKQIVCMFFSVNSSSFCDKNCELVRFVLNKDLKGINLRYRVFAYFNRSERSRQTAVCAMISTTDYSRQCYFSEFTFPPLGYVMTFDSFPPDNRLVDISDFSKFSFDESKEVILNPPLLDVYNWVPGDYRSRLEIERFAGERSQK